MWYYISKWVCGVMLLINECVTGYNKSYSYMAGICLVSGCQKLTCNCQILTQEFNQYLLFYIEHVAHSVTVYTNMNLSLFETLCIGEYSATSYLGNI